MHLVATDLLQAAVACLDPRHCQHHGRHDEGEGEGELKAESRALTREPPTADVGADDGYRTCSPRNNPTGSGA
jgi:hypothetical protein